MNSNFTIQQNNSLQNAWVFNNAIFEPCQVSSGTTTTKPKNRKHQNRERSYIWLEIIDQKQQDTFYCWIDKKPFLRNHIISINTFDVPWCFDQDWNQLMWNFIIVINKSDTCKQSCDLINLLYWWKCIHSWSILRYE